MASQGFCFYSMNTTSNSNVFEFRWCFEIAEDFTNEEIRTVIGILDTNTYQILVRSSPTIQDFVCGLYLRTSRLNHHCKPNTRPVFAGESFEKISLDTSYMDTYSFQLIAQCQSLPLKTFLKIAKLPRHTWNPFTRQCRGELCCERENVSTATAPDVRIQRSWTVTGK